MKSKNCSQCYCYDMFEICLIFFLISTNSGCPTTCQCSSVVTDCSHRNFTSIPSDVSLRTEQLLLSNNKIDSLQHTYNGGGRILVNLQLLDLRHNQISFIPDLGFEHFRLLKELYLDFNQIDLHSQTYPFEAISFHLEKVSLSHNQVSGRIEEQHFFYGSNLVYMNLSHNKISSFHNTSFPEKISTLDLSFNEINKSSSYYFGYHPKLLYLDFRGQIFKHFDGETFEGLDNLQELKLGGKNLETVSETLLSGLDNLTTLFIVDSRISDLPSTLLNSANNLEDLDLSNNQLQTLDPRLFTHTIHLKNLNLRGNQISNLSGLTPALKRVDITDLNLSFNSIRDSVSLFLTKNRRLVRVTFSHNLIQRINENVRSRVLEEIDLSFNRIFFINSRAFIGCTALKKLDLTGNKLVTFPDLDVLPTAQIFVAQNTWNCTCNFYKLFMQYELSRKPKKFLCSSTISDLSCLRCTFPSVFLNQTVREVGKQCSSNFTTSNMGYISVVYVVVAVLFFVVVLVVCVLVNKPYFCRLIRKTGRTSAVSHRYNPNCTAAQTSEVYSYSSRTAFVAHRDPSSEVVAPCLTQSNENQELNDNVYIKSSTCFASENCSDSVMLNYSKTNVSSDKTADVNANSIDRKSIFLNQSSHFYETYPRLKRHSQKSRDPFLNKSNTSIKSLPGVFSDVS